jgi:hypothetical protein
MAQKDITLIVHNAPDADSANLVWANPVDAVKFGQFIQMGHFVYTLRSTRVSSFL